jgi:hypothetical protein
MGTTDFWREIDSAVSMLSNAFQRRWGCLGGARMKNVRVIEMGGKRCSGLLRRNTSSPWSLDEVKKRASYKSAK